MGPEALKELRTLLADAKTTSYEGQDLARNAFIGHGEALLNRVEELEGGTARNTPGYGQVCIQQAPHEFQPIGDPYEGMHAPKDDSRFGWRRRLFCLKCGATMEIPDENPYPGDRG